MTPSTTRLFAALTLMLALAAPGRAPAAEGAATGAVATVAAKTADTPQDPTLEAFVDGLVRDSLVQDHIAGATVAIVQDGRVVLKKGYGAASLNPWRPVDLSLIHI